MASQAARWNGLVGSRIERVDGGAGGQTRISLSSGGGDHTVVVAHTQGVWSSVRSTPSGAVERVTPVFTDGGAMVRLETDRGEELLVAGGGAWLT
jgi:hypothetical protein